MIWSHRVLRDEPPTSRAALAADDEPGVEGMQYHAINDRKMIRAVAAVRHAISSFLRGLPLFLARRPRTPLRVLCIMAFDLLHRLGHAAPLARDRIRTLAALLDFGACANAVFDNKNCCRHEYHRTLRLLEEVGIGPEAAEYLRRLRDLEAVRPSPGGDDRRLREVARYREDVVRLSLGMVAAIAEGRPSLHESIRATGCQGDLNLLFRIVMLCQIIDDVLDYRRDLSGGLPSFLTAADSLPKSFEFTRHAAHGYADGGHVPHRLGAFPLQAALSLVSIGTQLMIALARLRLMYSVRRGVTSAPAQRTVSSGFGVGAGSPVPSVIRMS